MATALTSECNLLAVPFNAATDFTDLADYRDRFAETLIECHDPALNEPIPPHLTNGFITNVLPDLSPGFEPDAESLCDYCQALTQTES